MKCKTKKRLYYVFAVLALVLFQPALSAMAQAEVTIIANPSVPIDTVTKDELKKIYMGKIVKWVGGEQINSVLLNVKDVHNEFVTKYIKKTPAQFDNYWRMMIFSGKGIRPQAFNNEQDLIEFVAKTKGAIGYVLSTGQLEKIKILGITGN